MRFNPNKLPTCVLLLITQCKLHYIHTKHYVIIIHCMRYMTYYTNSVQHVQNRRNNVAAAVKQQSTNV